MKKLNPIQIIVVIGVFLGLWFAYDYFTAQALVSSGRANTNTVVQLIYDGEHEVVKQQLVDYVGLPEEQTEKYEPLKIALINVDYVRSIFVDGTDYQYVGEMISDDNEYPVFKGVYSIPAEQGGEDFVVVSMSREDGEWELSNFSLTATNPIED